MPKTGSDSIADQLCDLLGRSDVTAHVKEADELLGLVLDGTKSATARTSSRGFEPDMPVVLERFKVEYQAE